MGDMLNISDIARMAHVSRQRIFAMTAEDPDFPAPILDAPRRRLWDETDVLTWLNHRQARTGSRAPRVASNNSYMA